MNWANGEVAYCPQSGASVIECCYDASCIRLSSTMTKIAESATRSVPRSRWHPQFNREPLRASLEQRRIGYQSLPALGGRPPLAGQALEDEIAKLLPPHERTCWMCSEGDPHQCHRRSLLEPVILGLGCAVRQILPDGSLEEGPSSRVG